MIPLVFLRRRASRNRGDGGLRAFFDLVFPALARRVELIPVHAGRDITPRVRPSSRDDWRMSVAETRIDTTGSASADKDPKVLVSGEEGSSLTWRMLFGGRVWAHDAHGVYSRTPDGKIKHWRSGGSPETVEDLIARFGDAIEAAAVRHDIPRALIVMLIATASASLRRFEFTGPRSFHWESDHTLRATGLRHADGKQRGDYRAGPMLILADTARRMNTLYDLGYDNAQDFRVFAHRPPAAPSQLSLYDPAISIDVGAALIRHNLPRTGTDPILVAAAFGAGGLYPSANSAWRIKSRGDTLDRAAEWYGDACAVLGGPA